MIAPEKIITSPKLQEKNILHGTDVFLFAAYVIFLVSIVFSLRAISSISIGLILLISLITNKGFKIDFTGNRYLIFFLSACSLVFLTQCISLVYTNNISEGLKLLQRSSGMVLLPIAVLVNGKFFTKETYRRLMFYFASTISIASLYCLGFALLKFATGSSYKIFFYHDLVKPLSQHAIQFSILVFSVLVFLIEDLKEEKGLFHLFQRAIIFFLSLFLVLLASKLIITFYVLYLLLFFFRERIDKNKSQVFAVCLIVFITAVVLTPNPISNRFRGLFTGNSLLFEQKEFNPGIYFNGVQFRLLQWRFTYEILNEQNAWITGVTPGDAQSFLDKKYSDTKMYTGGPGTKDRGFLGYHTHNQFLQVVLENGLPALLFFLFACYSLYKMADINRRKELRWTALLLLVYCFTDAPLQTQYGLVIFAFLPSLFYSGKKSVKLKDLPAADTEISETNFAVHDISFQRQPN